MSIHLKARVSDKIDIAVWKLDEDVANDLSKKYSFFSYNDIDFNHTVSSKPQYLIVVFLGETRQKIMFKRN